MQSTLLNAYINKSQAPASLAAPVAKKEVDNVTQKDEYIKSNTAVTQKQKKTKKVSDFVSLTAIVATVAYLIYKNKFSDLKFLKKHIDFTPAKTVDEAIEFGLKTLKIEEYSGFNEGDLDVINWFNEGLVNTSNALKGKIRMPKKIIYSAINDDTVAGVITDRKSKYFGRFRLNRNVFSAIDEKLKSRLRLNDNYFKRVKVNGNVFDVACDEPQRLLDAFKNGKATYNEKIQLYEYAKTMYDLRDNIFESPIFIIKNLIKKYDIDLKELCDISFEELYYKSNGVQADVLAEIHNHIFNKTGKNPVIDLYQRSSFNTIYHEMGHIQDIIPRADAIYKFNDGIDYPQDLVKWLNDKKNIQIARSVSVYCEDGPGEFIAEAFATILDGNKLNDEALNLYQSLLGPKISNK